MLPSTEVLCVAGVGIVNPKALIGVVGVFGAADEENVDVGGSGDFESASAGGIVGLADLDGVDTGIGGELNESILDLATKDKGVGTSTEVDSVVVGAVLDCNVVIAIPHEEVVVLAGSNHEGVVPTAQSEGGIGRRSAGLRSNGKCDSCICVVLKAKTLNLRIIRIFE